MTHAQLVQHRAKHVADERRDVAENAANEPLDILEEAAGEVEDAVQHGCVRANWR